MTFLSVDPSLDFGSGAGAGVGVCADGGVGADVVGVGTGAVVGAAGAVGVADVAVAAAAGVATASAVQFGGFRRLALEMRLQRLGPPLSSSQRPQGCRIREARVQHSTRAHGN